MASCPDTVAPLGGRLTVASRATHASFESGRPRVVPAPGPGAIVLGGDRRGLGIVRSLGRRGVPVWVLTDGQWLAATSRYARRSLRLPASQHEQLALLMEIGADLTGWTLFPTDDEGAALLARHHDALAERFRLTVPPWRVLRWAYDKRLTHELADALGIDQPETHFPASRAALAALAPSFPAILKPAFKPSENAFTHAKAWRVENRDELVAGYDQACRHVPADAILVQELIPGGGEMQYSVGALCHAGDVLALVVARRIRQYPVEFGRSSSFVETIEQPEVEEAAIDLLGAMGYSGLAEVEFKRDPRDGRFKLLEVNPRTWGWQTVAARAGVDFPHLAWRLARGESVRPARARPGVGWVHLVADLPAALGEMCRGRLSPVGYLRSLCRPFEPALLAGDDPLPAAVELPLLFQRAWRRRATRLETRRTA